MSDPDKVTDAEKENSFTITIDDPDGKLMKAIEKEFKDNPIPTEAQIQARNAAKLNYIRSAYRQATANELAGDAFTSNDPEKSLAEAIESLKKERKHMSPDYFSTVLELAKAALEELQKTKGNKM